jgi:hypothetical protein
MTPREITEMRNAAMDLNKIAERFGSESTAYVVIRDAERRLYEVAKHFEGRNMAAARVGET